MKNKLSYLGFLGFFAFFYYGKVTPDELFRLHVKNAATRAFFTWLVIGTIGYCVTMMTDNVAYLRFLNVMTLVIALLVFAISLERAEQREKKGLLDEDED